MRSLIINFIYQLCMPKILLSRQFFYFSFLMLVFCSTFFILKPAKADLFYSQPDSDSQTFFGRSTGNYYMGSTFINPAKYDICEIKVRVSRGGSGHSDGVYVNLYQTSSDSVPNSGTFIASSNVISAGSLPGAHTFATFTFPSSICYAIQANTRYGVTIHRTGGMSDSAYYILYSKYQSGVTQWYGSYRTSWVRLDSSSSFLKMALQTYGTTVPAFDSNMSLQFKGFYQIPYSADYSGPVRSYLLSAGHYSLQPASVATSSAKMITSLTLKNKSAYLTSFVLTHSKNPSMTSAITESKTLDSDKSGVFNLPYELLPDEKIYFNLQAWLTVDGSSQLYQYPDMDLQYINATTSAISLDDLPFTSTTTPNNAFNAISNSIGSGVLQPFSEKMPLCFVKQFTDTMLISSSTSELVMSYTIAGIEFNMTNFFSNEIFTYIAIWSNLLFKIMIFFGFIWLGIKTIERIQL